MHWYVYVCAVFAGAFLANATPHFVKGICGEPFPLPFVKPPGRGLSSPLVNVLWGVLNLVIGLSLFYYGKLHHHPCYLTFFLFFAGMLAMSLMLGSYFGKQTPPLSFPWPFKPGRPGE